jgi:hypothetical protein
LSAQPNSCLSGACFTRFDLAVPAQNAGDLGRLRILLTRQRLPDGNFSTQFPYPDDLQAQRRATGAGLYNVLGIGCNDAKELQLVPHGQSGE